MNIAIYSRKSKFSETGDSVENQVKFCKDYARIHFQNIQEKEFLLYEDEGFSAATTERPNFQKLLEDIKQKKINMLLCYRLDRISRSVGDFSDTLKLLEKYQVSFVSATENFDTSTPMGKAMIYIASVFAQLERETIAERVRDNMLALAKKGRWLGGIAPLGFRSDVASYFDEEWKERQLSYLTPVENDLKTVKCLFQKYLELKSLSKVETYCLTHGLTTSNQCDFTKNTISLIIENPVYCIADQDAFQYFQSLKCILPDDKENYDGTHGLMCYNRKGKIGGKQTAKNPPDQWIIAVARHKGIISGKHYALVQSLLYENKIKAAPRNETSEYAALSGLVTCNSCGSKMRIKSIQKTSKGINFYYICELKSLSCKARCSMKNIKGTLLDDLVMEKLKELLESCIYSEEMRKLLQKKGTFLLENHFESEKELYKLQEEYKNNHSKIQKYLSNYGETDSEAIKKYMVECIEDLEERQQLIQNQLKESDINKTQINDTLLHLNDLYQNIINIDYLIEQADLLQKKQLIRTFIKEIRWDGETASIILR